MDWNRAIDFNRTALLRVLATLFAMAGMVSGGGAVDSLPKTVHLRFLRILHPAESALRRVIVIMAHGLSVTLKPLRVRAKPAPQKPVWLRGGPIRSPNAIRAEAEAKAAALAEARRNHIPAFPLFDTRKRFPLHPPRRIAKHCPRILDLSADLPPSEAVEEAPLNTDRLCKRLLSMQRALEDLPAQAQRLARITTRRAETRRRALPIRSGWPPGYRKRRFHEVSQILADCQTLVTLLDEPPDIVQRRLRGTRYGNAFAPQMRLSSMASQLLK